MFYAHNEKSKLMDLITKEQFDSLDLPEMKISNN